MSSLLFIGAGSFGLTGNALYISDTHLYDSRGFSMSLTGDPTITNNSNNYSSNGFSANFNGNATQDQIDDCGLAVNGAYGCFELYFVRGGEGCGFCNVSDNFINDIDFEGCLCDTFNPPRGGPFGCYHCCNYLLADGTQAYIAVGNGPVGIQIANYYWPYMDCYIEHLSVVVNGKIMCAPTAWACDGDAITYVILMTEFAFRINQFYFIDLFYWVLINTTPRYVQPCQTFNCTTSYRKIKNGLRDKDLSKRKKIDFNERTILSSQQRKIK